MPTGTIVIIRENRLPDANRPYKIRIDGIKAGTISNGETQTSR